LIALIGMLIQALESIDDASNYAAN
jgi:hypothetical protein